MLKTRGFGERDEAAETVERISPDQDGSHLASARHLAARNQPEQDPLERETGRPATSAGTSSASSLIGAGPYFGHDPEPNTAESSSGSISPGSGLGQLRSLIGGPVRSLTGDRQERMATGLGEAFEPPQQFGQASAQPYGQLPVDPGIPPEVVAQHLLVVDDDDSVRSACCEIARRMGFHVHEADSVPAARAILKRASCGCIAARYEATRWRRPAPARRDQSTASRDRGWWS